MLRFIKQHWPGTSLFIWKTSAFCTKNGSYILQQHLHENHMNCPFGAVADSAAHFGLYIRVTRAGDFAEGLCALFCFVLFWSSVAPGISPCARPGQPQQEPSDQPGSLLISHFLPTLEQICCSTAVTSAPHPKHRRREQCRKTHISNALGLSALLEGGEDDGTGLIKQSNYLFN